MNHENKNFVGYEYQEIKTAPSFESLYADGYEHFGWQKEDTGHSVHSVSSVTMKFKRDRKIPNKTELRRLQQQFDACVIDIASLEYSKNDRASIVAYSIGIIGCVFLAGAIFSYMAGRLPLMVVLAIPALAGFVLPYFSFLRTRNRRIEAVTPLIDAKYDELTLICETANALLA